MNSLMSQPAFQMYAFTSAALVLIMYSLGFLTAKRRAERKSVVNAEDVGVNPGAQVVEVEHPDVQRIKRAHVNLLENAVPFFALGFLYCLTDPGVTMARALFLTFLAVRLFHAIFYVGAKQPFRTLSFAVGAIVNIIMVVQVLRAVIPSMM